MPSESLTAKQWLKQHPLAPGEQLYVVLGSASDARPLVRYYQLATPTAPIPIWGTTPYAGWQEVTPYVDQLAVDSPMLDWIEHCEEQDWGWLAVSRCTPQEVAEHLRGLTQVLMPDGTPVFFRFWDGRHLLPILRYLSEASAQVLPVFHRYWINGQRFESDVGTVQPAPSYPWWAVPQGLLDTLSDADPSTLVDNWLQRLADDYPQLYQDLPEHNLRLKLTQFARHTPPPQNTFVALLDYLNMELG